MRLKTTLDAGEVASFAFSRVSNVAMPGHKVRKGYAAQLWDAVSGKLHRTLTGFRESPFVSWSPDGQRLLTTHWGRSASVWNAHTGERVCELSGLRRDIRDVKWSPDGRTIMPMTQDDGVKASWLDELSFHPTRQLLMAANNRFIRFWNPTTCELLQTLENTSPPAQWNSDGRLSATLAKDQKSLQIWELL